MNFYFITNSASVAAYAAKNGVDRLFVDLEILGKDERQGHLNTVISRHTFEDLERVRAAAPSTELVARLNPINPDTRAEVDRAVRCGANTLMLPMFHSASEVELFSSYVAGRAKICLLVETIGAMDTLRDCVAVPGVIEVHIGLNDLHLAMRHAFMFEPLTNGCVEEMARQLREANIPFGIGGVARVGEGMLPAELILSEHARLGSTAAILSRTFHRDAKSVEEIEADMDFCGEVEKLRGAYLRHCESDVAQLLRNQKEVKRLVEEIVRHLQAKTRSDSNS
ncbi:aldolase/citrate lyase family protein [Pollutimonas thiosulfatoxidans]|uniref:HpcH/HpaI aldolase/citrate lyase domain-containing protein n=1 Tax=Pollutimonas thiosulfatoxidans TaxID=2028345 RepID=A0A410GEH7_9BURK|nr:aldolase/citrate lyase family protein [Pollutimonas thiosulfatoxidans]QAA94707.1 hypothetical protein CKA81_13295 [Pollutimonas thiosulfatoxidans]